MVAGLNAAGYNGRKNDLETTIAVF